MDEIFRTKSSTTRLHFVQDDKKVDEKIKASVSPCLCVQKLKNILTTARRNSFYDRLKLFLCLLKTIVVLSPREGGNRKWVLSKLFASLRSALSERGGVSSVAIGFHPHGKIKICGHPSRLCHPCAIIHPGVLCGESMLAPHSYFKKMFFNTF